MIPRDNQLFPKLQLNQMTLQENRILPTIPEIYPLRFHCLLILIIFIVSLYCILLLVNPLHCNSCFSRNYPHATIFFHNETSYVLSISSFPNEVPQRGFSFNDPPVPAHTLESMAFLHSLRTISQPYFWLLIMYSLSLRNLQFPTNSYICLKYQSIVLICRNPLAFLLRFQKNSPSNVILFKNAVHASAIT